MSSTTSPVTGSLPLQRIASSGVVCAGCGRTSTLTPAPAGWSFERRAGRVHRQCEPCTRAALPAIETHVDA